MLRQQRTFKRLAQQTTKMVSMWLGGRSSLRCTKKREQEAGKTVVDNMQKGNERIRKAWLEEP